MGKNEFLREKLKCIFFQFGDAIATELYRKAVSDYEHRYCEIHGKAPSEDLLNKVAERLLEQDWKRESERVLAAYVDEIICVFSDEIERENRWRFGKDMTVATCVITVVVASVFSGTKPFMTDTAGTIDIALILSGIFSALYGIKMIWRHI